MLFSDAVLLVFAFALAQPFARADKLFDQEVIIGDGNVPLTIRLQTEKSVSHPTEISFLDLVVTGHGPLHHVAEANARKHADDLEHILTEVSKRSPTPVESWERFDTVVKVCDDNADESCAYSMSPLATLEGTTPFSVRWNNFVLVDEQDVMEMLTRSTAVTIEDLRWELTTETLENLTALDGTLAGEAYDVLEREAENYARSIDMTNARLTEVGVLHTRTKPIPPNHDEWEKCDVDIYFCLVFVEVKVVYECVFEIS